MSQTPTQTLTATQPRPGTEAAAAREPSTGLPHAGGTVPTPASLQRDADGRLVEVRWQPHDPGRQPAGGRWLLAFDGSPHAVRAARQAAAMLAAGLDAAVTVLYVHPWLAREAAETGLARKGWELTAAAREAFAGHGLPLGVHVAMGEPADVILEAVRREQCAGVVMGSHGWSALEALVIGSVTQRVLSASTIPVLVTR